MHMGSQSTFLPYIIIKNELLGITYYATKNFLPKTHIVFPCISGSS